MQVLKFAPSKLVASAVLVSFLTFSGAAAMAQRATFLAKEKRVPDVVTSGAAKRVGDVEASRQFELAVSVPVRNQEALTKLIEDVYNPSSPNYHHYITVSQFADNFGASKEDYAKIVKYLRANGFNVTVQHANRLAVSFTGDAETIDRAFNVKMGLYQHPTEDRTFYAPDREPTVEGLGVKLQLVAGLDNFILPVSMQKSLAHKLGLDKKGDVIKSPEAVTTCYGSPYTVNVGTGPCGTYTPGDLRTAYGVTSLTGSGQAIGIFGFGGALTSDVAVMAGQWGITTPTVTYKLGTACTTGCSTGEQVLDIDMAHGMAPSASINFFSNANNDLTIINAMASDTTSSVYSCSWGWASGNYTTEDIDFQEMAAQGQTFLKATGDDGGYNGYYSRTNGSPWYYPAGDPYIVEVGGTQLITNGNGGSWSNEEGWPDGGGGVAPATAKYGTSTNYGVNYAQPSWQSGVSNSSNGVSATNRTDPDIAAEADYEYIGCTNGSCEDTYGGTSYATPLWAGIVAGMNTVSVAASNGSLGFVNYQLYAAGNASSGFTGIFHDVTACGGVDANEGPGPNCNSSTLSSGTYPKQGYNPVAGYDGVTGWGSPNGSSLISSLTVPGFSLTPTTGYYGTSFAASINFPDASGTSKFYAKQGSNTAVQVGSCTLTTSTCSANFNGSTLGLGSYNGYVVYTESETYHGTTRTVSKTSANVAFTISADTTATSGSASPSSIFPNGSTSLSATVTDSINSALKPTGTVNFKLGSSTIGSCTLSSGSCSTSVAGSAFALGSNSVTISFAGSTDFAASSNSTSVTVTQDSTSTAVTATPSTITGSGSSTLKATVSDTTTPANTPAGTITFKAGATALGGCTLSGGTCSTPVSGSTLGGGSFTITATYAPATSEWTASSGTTPLSVGADITFSSTTHNFGSVAIGQTATYGVKVTNNTASAISFTIGIAGPSNFSQTNNCFGGSVGAGASCEILFAFKPTATGAQSTTWSLTGPSGTIYSPTNGGTLSGTGAASQAITLATAGHNFGTQSVGTTSVVYGTVLTNSYSAAAAVSISITGNTADFVTVLNNCGSTLPANGSCNLQFEFKPAVTGWSAETVGITATVNGSPVTITTGSPASTVTGIALKGLGQ